MREGKGSRVKDEEGDKEGEKGHTSPNRDYKKQRHPIMSPYQTQHLPLSNNEARGKKINMLGH